MPKIIIAIDGHSSTGKSTVAKQLADYLDYTYVDSGAMYRAVTLFAIREGFINEHYFNKEKLIEALPKIQLAFKRSSHNKPEIYLNNEPVEDKIRTLAVSKFVSPIATLPEVRKKLVQQQQEMGKSGGIVMDGRDITTVVFPNAHLKIFMTASAQVRAKRRYEELLARGEKITYKQVYNNVLERDHIDATREDSPLILAKDAIVIDNSETNVEDQFYTLLQLAKDRIAGRV